MELGAGQVNWDELTEATAEMIPASSLETLTLIGKVIDPAFENETGKLMVVEPD